MGSSLGLDEGAVAAWMAVHVPGCRPPIAFSLIAGGHSNLTFGATDATGARFVVRRGPVGAGAGRAHDMGREFRVIAALGATAVPVPGAIAVCDDERVNDGTFYVMSHVDGSVLDNEHAADRALPGAPARRRAGEQIVDVLADLHQVDVDTVGLGDAGRRSGFIERQVTRFRGIWERSATRELPAVGVIADRLLAVAPPQRWTGIVHGDYRIGNVMIAGDGTLTAVLDWELWALGDVLADVGFLLNNWYEPDDPTPLVFIERPPTVSGGFGTRAEVLERYARRTGFDVSAIEFYRAFQHWRMAVLAEGVKRRYEQAQLVSADVDRGHLDRRVLDLVELAELHLDHFTTGTTST